MLGNIVACSRFFAGKELEIISGNAPANLASLEIVQEIIDAKTMALPSFTYSSGPFPGSDNKGRIIGLKAEAPATRASLAALYCALMVSAQLDAVESKNQIIVDGPFSQNAVFLSILAQLRRSQKVYASELKDGTAAGAACLALMNDAQLPDIKIDLSAVNSATLQDLQTYHRAWEKAAKQG